MIVSLTTSLTTKIYVINHLFHMSNASYSELASHESVPSRILLNAMLKLYPTSSHVSWPGKNLIG